MFESKKLTGNTEYPILKPALSTGLGLIKDHRLTVRMVRAARRVADGEWANEQIAEEASIRPNALRKWRMRPDFRAVVRRYQEELAQVVFSTGIANKAVRIRKMNDRYKAMNRLIEARAKDAADNPVFTGVPGKETGLVVREQKGVGAGTAAEVVDVFLVDTGLLREMRELEEQVAKEMGGQFEEAASGPGGDGAAPLVTINFPVLSHEDLKAIESAVVIDLPQVGRRLLQRPSDGKPR